MGGMPSCLSTKSEKGIVKVDANCLSFNTRHQHIESYCVEVPMKEQSKGKNAGILVSLIIGVFILMVLLAFGFFILWRLYCPRGISDQHLLHKAVQDSSAAGFSSELLTNARFVSEAVKLGTTGLPVCRSYTFEELKEATKNFDNSAFMGEGSYGKGMRHFVPYYSKESKGYQPYDANYVPNSLKLSLSFVLQLYKGRLENGALVAIRCLPLSKKYSIRNLKISLDLLAKLRHPHLVCLLGHCVDVGGRDDCSMNKVFLISEYVPSGSFHMYLAENSYRKVLNWSERLAVLISVAKAEHFLHTGIIPGFFHSRLKTNNILLNEHGLAKLSDYGLSIISEGTDKCGAKGEGLRSWQMKNLKDDVCSFGFILLGALVGPSVYAKRDVLLLNEMKPEGIVIVEDQGYPMMHPADMNEKLKALSKFSLFSPWFKYFLDTRFFIFQASINSPDGQKRIVDPVVQATCSQESLSIVISIMNKCISLESYCRPSIEDVLLERTVCSSNPSNS
ncbi:probable inactive leucine-rich repeat receptor-like protein kinase At3g03770 [Fagus crenata]